ncbi:MAG: acyl-CoA dehydrogenase [Planctomycetes bacterium]|nr:acyl-CoA dehydrogenase [Planctomycetota bacterium]
MSPSKEELEARELAEASREKTWHGNSFLKELFLGRFRLDLVHPYPVEEPNRPEFTDFFAKLEGVLRDVVDPVEIDATGEYPPEVVDALREIGAFGMKVPVEYGGLGLTHPEYVRCMKLLGSYDANVTALLSAHQAIGVPNPLKMFGSKELKEQYLPRCAKGSISAFALTEPQVGSDPGKLATTAVKSEDGTHYVLNGVKLWCTNGTLADLLVVMAHDPGNGKIHCFVVETAWEGVKVDHRSRFMGLKALSNAQISFNNVKIPAGNLIGKEGEGLKIALVTLNTGRLSLPAGTAGAAKGLTEMCRKWASVRVQWGAPIGKHEAIAHKVADIAASAFAMEAVSEYCGDLADRDGADIRLEAAAAKEWNTVRAWRCVDEGLQVRGGRGYETERSLKERGDCPIGIERMMRDSRINLIFEGSSEIMHLFIAREAVDKHLQVAGGLIDPKVTLGKKLALLPKVGMFYVPWYAKQWLSWGWPPRYGEFGKLAKHMRFVHRSGRKLARNIFHGMVRFGPRLEKKQAFLFRCVDVALELFVMTCAVARAHRMQQMGDANAKSAQRLADLTASNCRDRVRQLFGALWSNDDDLKYGVGREVLDGTHEWLEKGIMGLGVTPEDLAPPSMDEMLKEMRGESKASTPDRDSVTAC